MISLLWLQAARQLNRPEFRILGLALGLAIFAITLVSNLGYAFKAAILGESSTILGADLVLESSQPIPSHYVDYAKTQQLATSEMIEFFSMVVAGEKMQLACIVGVDNAFPLRGKMTIATSIDQEQKVVGAPDRGQIWVAENLAISLPAQWTQQVAVGKSTFTVSGMLKQYPVAMSDLSVLAPLAYINRQDVAQMDVLQPGSRAIYRFMMAGTPQQLHQFEKYFHDNSSQDITLISPQSGRPALSRSLNTTQRYMTIILLIQVLIGGIAIALSARYYGERQQRAVALWRCLGATSQMIIWQQARILFLLGFATIGVAISLGYLSAFFLLYSQNLPEFSLSWQSGCLAAAMGLFMLLGFAFPSFYALRKVSPVQIVQHGQFYVAKTHIITYFITLIILGLFLLYFVEDVQLALQLEMQIGGLVAVSWVVGWGIWWVVKQLAPYGGLAWRFGLSYFVRHRQEAITQWSVLTLALTLLYLVIIIRQDFLQQWQAELPATTPNYFLINIQPKQIASLQRLLSAHHINAEFYPIVRARMTEINHMRIDGTDANHPGLQRPLNLTWMKNLPQDNHKVAGLSWEQIPAGEAWISVENGFAQRQGISLQDTLGFQLADEHFEGRVVQFRTVPWESFKPNFFIIFPRGVLENFPHDYLTSFYLPTQDLSLLYELHEQAPEISIIDVREFIDKTRYLIAKVTLFLGMLFAFILVLGLLILYINILTSMKERLQESAMLQIMGAKKWFVAKILLAEFFVLGVFSSLFAFCLAWLIARRLAVSFEVALVPDTWWGGILFGSLSGIVVMGFLGARSVFRSSPLKLLREG